MTGGARSGRIVTRFGAEMIIEDACGALRRCTALRKLDQAVCGDRVRWEPAAQGNDQVTALEPRHNALTRIDARGREKTIAANIDQIVIVSAVEPPPNWEMVDRYLIAARLLDAKALILMNKSDLRASQAEDEAAQADYRTLGYTLLRTSIKSGEGLESLRNALHDKTSILVGLSGVGKSSLIKALLPDLDLRIGAISEASGKGRHTTTGATLYPLPEGGDLIDSPGVRNFELGPLDSAHIAQGFIEFHPYLDQCRFHNCRHIAEPGCAVKQALSEGRISMRRYRSYRHIVEAPSSP